MTTWIDVNDVLPENQLGFDCMVSITNDCCEDEVSPATYICGEFYAHGNIKLMRERKSLVGVTHWSVFPPSVADSKGTPESKDALRTIIEALYSEMGCSGGEVRELLDTARPSINCDDLWS